MRNFMRQHKFAPTTLLTLLLLLCLGIMAPARADVPGGLLETPASALVRPKLSAAQIQSMLPARGAFTFPAPYNTQGVRLTNASDCAGGDCLWYVGYSYWRNMNNHVGSDTMYVFLSLDRNRGGGGPTLFSYNKLTEAVQNLGPLFSSGSALSWNSADGWYFSGTMPTKMYVNDGPRMLRYDVLTKQSQTVFDVSSQFGADKVIWQMHSSDDDKVHSATLRATPSYEMLGCVVYREDTAQFQYFPKQGNFDECNLDRSGRWLMSLEDIDYQYGLEMRIFDLANGGAERMVWDQNGAVGHADMGYGYVVGTDNWNQLANSILAWDFSKNPLAGQRVFHNNDWYNPPANHISHTNATASVPMNQQYACGSHAAAADSAWANEVICFRLDGSLQVLVVAPVMVDMNSSVGGDGYAKAPKGNLDVTGQYFIWTSNSGGSRVDAFIAKVPSQVLMGGAPVPDTTLPAVAITSPPNGSTVSGSITITANASDNIGVAGVQFRLNGVNLGAEDTTAPYSVAWNTATTAAGVHLLTAAARDAAGNASVSDAVTVTIAGDTTAPAVSAVATSNVSTSGATITWTTSELSDSQLEYGVTASYGSMTTLNSNLLLSHTQSLSGLAAGTLYHYRVRSRDLAGNLAVSADASFTTTASAPAPGPGPSGAENVVWTSLVNVTASGNSLQKTSGCDGCADAGSLSQQQISSGSGYLEFTVSETNLVRFIGLNNNSTGTSPTEIPFAFKIVSGYAEVRENGQYRWDVPVITGDVLRISVDSGAVKYAKNGVTFYTSQMAASYPLRADTALTSFGATLNNVKIAGSASAPSGPQAVAWTNRINVTATGNSLKKTSGCDGCADAGAVSQQQIASGNGYMEFTVSETGLVRFVGFNNSNAGTSTTEIPFAFKLVSGYAEARERGQYRSDVPVVTGDVLRISVQSGVVKYAKNGVVFYTSSAAPSYPLMVDTALTSLNATVNNVKIATTP
jgi:hypothetical protein